MGTRSRRFIIQQSTFYFISENKAPQIIGANNFNVTVGQTSRYDVTTTDSDGDAVTVYMPFGPPPGAIFTNTSSGTAVIMWTPSNVNEVNFT